MSDDGNNKGKSRNAKVSKWLAGVLAAILAGIVLYFVLPRDVPQPLPEIIIDDVEVNERDGNAVIRVRLSKGGDQDIGITVSTGDLSAKLPEDYVETHEQITFTAGIASKTFKVLVKDDDIQEPNETFLLFVSEVEGGSVVDVSDTAICTIRDSDQSASPTASAPDPYIVRLDLTIHTTQNDLDRESQLNFYIVPVGTNPKEAVPEHELVGGPVTKGHGEVWPDGDVRTYSIIINKGKTFVFDRRFDYAVMVVYGSTKGDPNWIGKLTADAILSNGERRPVLQDTGNFELGHHDNKTKFDRVARVFVLNE